MNFLKAAASQLGSVTYVGLREAVTIIYQVIVLQTLVIPGTIRKVCEADKLNPGVGIFEP